jgi:oxygen-independent coproporphyrinogen III oxidase
MAGIYIHIPYCKKACHYCNFHFSTNLKTKKELVSALIHEIKQDQFISDEKIETIYFGGGTPSLLDSEELLQIMDTIHQVFEVLPEAEVSLEANPDDVSVEIAQLWQRVGINRISLGVQSFFDEDLFFMNRAHTSNQAKESISILQAVGFDNITIDLIYGSPTTTLDMWQKNVEFAIQLNIPHISSYCLTVEPKTALAHQVKKGLVLIDDSLAIQQFEILMDQLVEAGYDHYEISNFGKPSYYSRHNTSYWQDKFYHGLGPGAHSYNGSSRRWNISNNALYIQNVKDKIPHYEEEILTINDKYNEYIMTRLRTHWGINADHILDKFGEKFHQSFEELLLKIDPAHYQKEEKTIRLTRKGKFFADRIASELFIT